MCGGDPYRYLDYMQKITLFPACAGVIPIAFGVNMLDLTFPRMCGGDPVRFFTFGLMHIFSPHVRG